MASDEPTYQQEREERRGLEQRAATLIASMLVTIGLAASAGPSVVAQGSLPKFSLVAAVAVLAAAIVLLAYGLMPCGKATPVPTAKDVENANLRILKPIWTGTALLAVGVLFAAVALISAFLGDREAALGSKDRPVHVAR